MGFGILELDRARDRDAGQRLNIVEKVTGQVAGFDQTIFTAYNLVPVALLLILIPLALRSWGRTSGRRSASTGRP